MFIVPLSGLESISSIQGKEMEKDAGRLNSEASLPFKDLLGEAARNLGEAQAASEKDAYDLVAGDISDLHTVSIHSAIQQTALEVTVQLTSRAISAYKEVLQMQI